MLDDFDIVTCPWTDLRDVPVKLPQKLCFATGSSVGCDGCSAFTVSLCGTYDQYSREAVVGLRSFVYQPLQAVLGMQSSCKPRPTTTQLQVYDYGCKTDVKCGDGRKSRTQQISSMNNKKHKKRPKTSSVQPVSYPSRRRTSGQVSNLVG